MTNHKKSYIFANYKNKQFKMEKEKKEQQVKDEVTKLVKMSNDRINRLRRIITGALTDNIKPDAGYTNTEVVMALLSEAYSIERSMIDVDIEVTARNRVEFQAKPKGIVKPVNNSKNG